MTNISTIPDVDDAEFDDPDLDDIEPGQDDRDGAVPNGGDLPFRLAQHDLHALLTMAGTKPVTEAQLRAGILKAYPGRHWDQLCQAFARDVCALFGHGGVGYASANAAYSDSHIKSTNPATAPAASFHYWRIGSFGHVAVGLGGPRVAMASTHVDVRWGSKAQALGVTTVQRYGARTGAGYRGWALTNGDNDFTFASLSTAAAKRRTDVRKLAKHLNSLHLGRHTTAEDDGVVGTNYTWLVQTEGHRDGTYPKSSPADGKGGPRTSASEAKQLAKLK